MLLLPALFSLSVSFFFFSLHFKKCTPPPGQNINADIEIYAFLISDVAIDEYPFLSIQPKVIFGTVIQVDES